MDKKALMEELDQLGKLHQAGVLSQAEFDAQKTAVLSQLQALRGGQTPMPSKVGGGQGHSADAFSTGFVGNEGQTSLTVGRVVGERYRLVQMLGRGGMGEVWLVEDIRLGRAFALKFLAAELVGSAEALSRMHREYEVLEKLSHLHIVRVFDLDQDKESGRWYLRMEYVAGEDMGEKIDVAAQQAHRPLFRMDTIVSWLEQLVNALDYAHQQGILHRDIKPANLMLTTEPQRLKVMDFGIARVVSGTHTTQHTAMMGSIYYAAPELLRGQAATPSADIYSFGVLVYEMLTGDLPVGRFALPSAVVRGVSKGVDDVLERMLQMNPTRRGASLREVWSPLRDALLGKAAKVGCGTQARATTRHDRSSPSHHLPHPKIAEPSAGERRVWTLSGVDFAMRWIPAGRFWMGAGKDDQEAFEDEKPQHEVTITRGFWMEEVPVTQGQYHTIMGETPSLFESAKAGLGGPVECVSWYDAAAFANKLSALEGCPRSFVGGGEEMEGCGKQGQRLRRVEGVEITDGGGVGIRLSCGNHLVALWGLGQDRMVQREQRKHHASCGAEASQCVGVVRHAGECMGVVL